MKRRLSMLLASALVLVAMMVAAPTALAQAPPEAICSDVLRGLPSPPQSFIGNPAYFNACVDVGDPIPES